MGAFHPILWMVGIGFWISIWFNGFIQTILWIAIITAIIIIIIKLKESIRV